MSSLKEVWMAIIMAGICVIVEYLDALIEGIDGEDDENFLPLNCCELEAEEGHKIPKHCTNR
jgi:hypothetical protein